MMAGSNLTCSQHGISTRDIVLQKEGTGRGQTEAPSHPRPAPPSAKGPATGKAGPRPQRGARTSAVAQESVCSGAEEGPNQKRKPNTTPLPRAPKTARALHVQSKTADAVKHRWSGGKGPHLTFHPHLFSSGKYSAFTLETLYSQELIPESDRK